MTNAHGNEPRVISMESTEREGFLSENGNFSPAERSIFHLLCQHWEPLIPVDSFTRTVTGSGSGTATDLKRLIEKLEHARISLFTTAMEDKQRHQRGIIFDDPNGPHFWAGIVDERYTDMLESIVAPLPLESRFQEEFGGVPQSLIVRPAVKEIASHITPEDEEPAIIAIPVTKKENVLILSHRIRHLTGLSIVKLRYYLGSANLLGELAKLQNTSLMVIKQGSGGNDPHFWLGLTKSIREHARELQGARIGGVDRNFFYLSAIVYVLVSAQLEEAQERKRLEEEKKADMDALVSSVQQAPQRFVPKPQLMDQIDRLKDRYGEQHGEFKQEFHSKYLTEAAQKKLPVIVLLRERYIHRDNLYPAFLQEFPEVQDQIRQVLVQRMRDSLFSFLGGQDSSFISTDALNETIKQEVEDRSIVVAEMIEHPAILAEAMIHHLKRNKMVKTSDDLRQHLSTYFDAVTMRALPLHKWFSIELKNLFTEAFRGLPVFKRIWIRITGKYDSYLETFTGRSSSPSATSTANANSGKGKKKRASSRSGSSKASKKGTPSAGSSGSRSQRSPATSSAARTASTKTAGGGESKRTYNPKQVESAWEQFGSSLKK